MRTGRSRTRYPELGRVPLHRRGTSKTYERLEDLLREAGYKETRVFTPEGEHTNHGKEEGNAAERRASMKEGVGAVVGFLANLMPGVTGSRSSSVLRTDDTFTSSREYSPPASPLANRQTGRSPALSDSPMFSSIESLIESTPKQKSSTPNYVQSNTRPPLSQRNSVQYPNRQLANQSSRSSFLRVPPPVEHFAHPQPSRAGAYLRHMASVPTIPARPSSTPANHASRISLLLKDQDRDTDDLDSLYTRRGNGEGEEEHGQPPLPHTWLETVARAVLFGGTGAYIGGPSRRAPNASHVSPTARTQRLHGLRATRSSLSQTSIRRPKLPKSHSQRTGLSDHTNFSRTSYLAPPTLFATGKADRSEGEVSHTRVTCRSAPGSRATSGTRSGQRDGRDRVFSGKERGRGRWKKDDRLPSLARTRTDGDAWERAHSGGAHPGVDKDVGSDADNDVGGTREAEHHGSSSEDEDGELDLARILVPAKRQKSIKSLRRHLGNDKTARRGVAGVFGVVPGTTSQTTWVEDAVTSVAQRRRSADEWDGGEEWGTGWVRKARKMNSNDNNEDDVEV